MFNFQHDIANRIVLRELTAGKAGNLLSCSVTVVGCKYSVHTSLYCFPIFVEKKTSQVARRLYGGLTMYKERTTEDEATRTR